jgi:hypothetical protein
MNPYLVFGIDKTTDMKTIKKKYHKMSLLYHPDKAKDKEDLEKRKEMFQLISLSYERIQKERGMNSFETENDNYMDIDIKQVIDNVCDIISDKWKEFSKQPIFRILSNLGIKGLMKVFEKNKDKYSCMTIKCSYVDIINNAKISGQFYRLDKDNNESPISIDNQIIYPYIMIENGGNYNHKLGKYRDLVIFTNLIDRKDFDFDYQNKCVNIKNKEDIEIINNGKSLLFNTQFGDFIVK